MIEVPVRVVIIGANEKRRREPVAGWVYAASDRLAVTEDYFVPGKFRVTHRKSGHGASCGLRWSRAVAERKRRALEPLANWDELFEAINS